ncbi:tyrosinase family protein [Amaricoccus solimangrovi]|uniref:Tyrosinase family protein n=1 Tax=Amaricoccus solimangrovi TaxID=2589815 RepID=A0A501X0Q7_9RHOB|nr:tyrosinase family protein [Amaricoccus solimangrovi]TPE52516.1 tyrosinase family protein [Amaricoccus solimangrovi]
MTFVRRNVHELGQPWADELLWYARGVKAMKARPLADPTSWTFYGAIHGIHRGLWNFYGITQPGDPDPSQADQDTYWNQCQHGSWYFLPWHRGYVLALEANVRSEIGKLGGPVDTWALPYWNYFKTGQNGLPDEFASPDWPDGTGDNPLFVVQRWGDGPGLPIVLDLSLINLSAMGLTDFTGTANGGSPGFGGVDTGFAHGGAVHGGIETQPHDFVHGLIGGGDPNDPRLPGLMSTPPAAALDPIFWLHHANIDRLWASWVNETGVGGDPTDARWLNGPASIGERAFTLPMPDGTAWTYTPGEMRDMAALDYEYDDLTPDGAAMLVAAQAGARAGTARGGMMAMAADTKTTELLGANTGALPISGDTATRTAVRMAPEPRARSRSAFAAAGPEGGAEKVFLNLENVRGLADAAAFKVYVGLPEGARPADHPDHMAGGVALFGVSQATEAEGEHAGSGLTYVLDITPIVTRLGLDTDKLHVDIVPVRPIAKEAEVSVGRVSVYRQGE